MKLTYIGPHDGVDLDLPDGSMLTVGRNEVVEIADEGFAALLLEQPSNWQNASEPKPAAPAKPADKKEPI